MAKYIRFISVLLLGLLVFLAADALAYQGEDCYGEPGCYGEGGGDEGGGGEPVPRWEGYTDGRLNPAEGEYYSIWCQNDRVEIWRAVPTSEMIKTVGLADVIALGIGQELALGDFMVLLRNSEDTITIYGSNGNLAPESGSKAFSLSQCIERNGGAPVASDSPPANQNQPPPADEGSGREEADESLAFCFESYDFFGGDNELLADCLDYVLATQQDQLPGTEILVLLLLVICLNIVVGNGILPVGIVLFLAGFRQWLRHWKPSAKL